MTLDRRFCTAPMMDWTDRHCRYFWRQLSRHAVLYTEMVTTGALLYGDANRFLAYSVEENPVALQLGGSDPEALARCALLAEQWGYAEVNLNVGCPSDRVQNGMIGAILMQHAELVRDGVAAMRAATRLPVTVKHRLGVDDHDSEAFLWDFVGTVAESGCKTFIVHARKALLQGLSPKENRDVPPLDYDRVARLKAQFPDLEIILNGGLDIAQAEAEAPRFDGVMLGRVVWQQPMLLAEVDRRFYGDSSAPVLSALAVAEQMEPYIAQQLAAGVKLHTVLKPLFNLFQNQRGARQFRRLLSEQAHRPGADLAVWHAALACVRPSFASA